MVADEVVYEEIRDDRWPDWRALVVYEEMDEAEPDGPDMAPVLCVPDRGRAWFRQSVHVPCEAAEILSEVSYDTRPEGVETSLMERFGAVAVDRISGADVSLYVFDTPDWRSLIGMSADTPGSLAAAVQADAALWRLWLEGDVFRLVVERRVDGDWEEVDSIGVFYGRDVSVVEARGFLEAVVASDPVQALL